MYRYPLLYPFFPRTLQISGCLETDLDSCDSCDSGPSRGKVSGQMFFWWTFMGNDLFFLFRMVENG